MESDLLKFGLVAIAMAGVAWKLAAWILNRIEKSIVGVNERISKLEDKIDSLASSVYELKGEVKGRSYAEMEQFIKELQKGD